MRSIPVMILFTAGLAYADAPARPGSIRGTVIFEGTPPPAQPERRDSDPYCAKSPVTTSDIVVTKGKLKDVLVRVKNGSFGTAHASDPPSAPVVLDQKGCTYQPRVVGIRAGQRLLVKNSDGTFHNVHGLVRGKNLWNKPHAPNDPPHELASTTQPGDVIDVVCDVHPWMHAYALVHDHPYFAVTGMDGAFTIDGLAPGTYQLEAWHPSLGAKTLTVKIGKGAKARVTARFSYKP